MGALADLWKSERGLVAIVLIVAMSVLTGMGSFTGEQWIDYTKWIGTAYLGSKTLTGMVALVKGTSDSSPPVAAAAPAPAPAAPAPAPATPPVVIPG